MIGLLNWHELQANRLRPTFRKHSAKEQPAHQTCAHWSLESGRKSRRPINPGGHRDGYCRFDGQITQQGRFQRQIHESRRQTPRVLVQGDSCGRRGGSFTLLPTAGAVADREARSLCGVTHRVLGVMFALLGRVTIHHHVITAGSIGPLRCEPDTRAQNCRRRQQTSSPTERIVPWTVHKKAARISDGIGGSLRQQPASAYIYKLFPSEVARKNFGDFFAANPARAGFWHADRPL